MTNFKEITDHYLQKILTSDKYLSPNVISDVDLLVPSFADKIQRLRTAYMEFHESTPVIFESYRSDVRQLICFQSGASKIRTSGMHHFGIAVDIIALDSKGNPSWNILDYGSLHKIASSLGLIYLDFEACHFQLIETWQQNLLRQAVTSAIIDFQKSHSLVTDGIPGIKTRSALRSFFKK
jgi:peptidoglycan hydrolase-like protein with peptidoglycan-binding domain